MSYVLNSYLLTYNALAQETGGELVGVCECVHDVQGKRVK